VTGIFHKLNLKDQKEILVLNAPQSFAPALRTLRRVQVARRITGLKELTFALTFVTRRSQLERLAKQLTGRASGDAVLWFAYPKGSSKRYRCEFNRDHGWQSLLDAGFDSVRQVAIDEDWSALRFRRVEFINRRSAP
jgi:hypothetical protein